MKTLETRTSLILSFVFALLSFTTLTQFGASIVLLVAQIILFAWDLTQSLSTPGYSFIHGAIGFVTAFFMIKMFGDDVIRIISGVANKLIDITKETTTEKKTANK